MDELKQLEKIQELERQIAGLPIGYISKKPPNALTFQFNDVAYRYP